MIYGVLMILVVYFLPEGIVPAVRDWWQRPQRGAAGRAAGRASRRGRADERAAPLELAVEGLTIRFGGLTAVDGMTFEVREGEVLSLIGPNGAGKTTAFNAITGYIEPAGGEHRLSRRAAQRPQAQRRSPRWAWCARSRRPACSPARRVHDNVLIGLHLRSQAAAARHPARACRRWRARRSELADEAARDPALRRPGGARATSRPRRCPTASCGCSRWRSRWPPGRSCCCSTSRCPA